MKDDLRIKKTKATKEDKSYGKYLRIGDEAEWQQNFYQLLKNDSTKKDMNLIIELNEQWSDKFDSDDYAM